MLKNSWRPCACPQKTACWLLPVVLEREDNVNQGYYRALQKKDEGCFSSAYWKGS